MLNNFWDQLFAQGRPVVGLSPMDGVTDAAMRYMTARYGSRNNTFKETPRRGFGGVDLMFTEFVSVDGLHYAEGDRRERILKAFVRARDVDYLSLNQKTIKPFEVAQVFGKTPEFFAEAAQLIEKLGFDGIDINMGCPAHKVEENGCGAGLIRNPGLAQEIIRVTQGATKLPVSVKTRIGVDHDEAEEWMEALMEVRPANISLHGRTLKQLYQGKADWEAIGRAAEIVHNHGGHILGNGDVESMKTARIKVKKYGVDGVLIGRAAEGNPGIFAGVDEPTREQRLAWALEHAKIYEKIFMDARPPSPEGQRTGTRQELSFLPVRKHLAWYCKGFPGASELRQKLVQANSAKEVGRIVNSAV